MVFHFNASRNEGERERKRTKKEREKEGEKRWIRVSQEIESRFPLGYLFVRSVIDQVQVEP